VNAQPENESAKDAGCEGCGSFEVMVFAGKLLCADCIALAGCGCAGHDQDEG
jgi:hypothetical protein